MLIGFAIYRLYNLYNVNYYKLKQNLRLQGTFFVFVTIGFTIFKSIEISEIEIEGLWKAELAEFLCLLGALIGEIFLIFYEYIKVIPSIRIHKGKLGWCESFAQTINITIWDCI